MEFPHLYRRRPPPDRRPPWSLPCQGVVLVRGWASPLKMQAVGGTAGRLCSCSASAWTSGWSQGYCPSPPRTRACGNVPSPAGSGGTSESPHNIWKMSPISDPWTSSCTLFGFSWSPWLLFVLVCVSGNCWRANQKIKSRNNQNRSGSESKQARRTIIKIKSPSCGDTKFVVS